MTDAPLHIRLCALLFAVVVIMAPGAPPLMALDIEFEGRAIKRDILVLYDRRQEGAVHLTRAHRFAQMPLNHLGYKLTYIDVNQPLPDVGQLQRYRGILSWFNEPLQNPERLASWLDRATVSGLRYVIMGEVVPPARPKSAAAINRILARLGLKDTGGYVNLTYQSTVASLNKAFIGFERPVDKVLPDFPVIVSSGTSAQVHLSVRAPVEGVPKTAVLVATNRNGGYAAQNFTFTYDANTDRIGWILNPFKFFKEAFGVERFPIPDTTTLAGRRIYFSHIDGDGWNNLSEIEAYKLKQKLSAEVIAHEAIEAFPDLPVSVALLAADIDLRLGGNPKGAPVARRLFALPQVEIASHTKTHPYDWQFFGHYSRAVEIEKIDRYQRPDTPLRQRLNAVMLRLADKKVPANRFNKYVAGTDDLPRTYLKDPFDLKSEVKGALDISQSLAPPGKRVRLYQWSGDTTPFPAAIKATRQAGVRNLNGGDSRYDAEYPSAGYVPPIARLTGGQRQIYAVNSNENTYTNDWTGPYFGLFMLKHTLNNTESPRRLKAFNLYYHMYSGEKASALAAVKYFLELARKSNVIPVAASHYATIADDFFNVELEQIDRQSWAVKARGAMQTVRFDDAANLEVDYSHSNGVLGANRHEGALYVALDQAVTRSVVSLRAIEGRGQTKAQNVKRVQQKRRGRSGKAARAVETAKAAKAAKAAKLAKSAKAAEASRSSGSSNGGQTRATVQRGQLAPQIKPIPDAQADPGHDNSGGHEGAFPPQLATLINSRWQLANMVHLPCGFSIDAKGFGKGDMVWRTQPRRGFSIVGTRRGEILSEETHWADDQGLLKLKIALNAIDPLQLRFTCHE